MNDCGNLNLQRCQVFLSKLGEIEFEQFKERLGDLSWLANKKGEEAPAQAQRNTLSKGNLTPALSKNQHNIYLNVKKFLGMPRGANPLLFAWVSNLLKQGKMPAKDRKFLTTLLKQLGLVYDVLSTDNTKSGASISIDWSSDDDASDEESHEAQSRILKRYDSAEVLDEKQIVLDNKARQQRAIETEFFDFKRDYYKEKLDVDFNDSNQVAGIVYSYIEGVQWVLQYYFHGVPSWGWFYPHHYAPRLSDIVGFAKMSFKFELGTPFRPFDQLMGVLPALSRAHVPESLQVILYLT